MRVWIIWNNHNLKNIYIIIVKHYKPIIIQITPDPKFLNLQKIFGEIGLIYLIKSYNKLPKSLKINRK